LKTQPEFLDDHHLRAGGLDFHCCYQWDGRDDVVPEGFLPVAKLRDQVERYLRLRQDMQAEMIVELGIDRGGSAALLHALFHPRRLVAIELASAPAAVLSEYIRRYALEDVIHPHYGCNQADRDGLMSIMAAELAGQPLDLVIDDASHLLAETRASFEVLFPLLRPGGLYVIEDWNADHLIADHFDTILADPSSPEREVLAEALGQAHALHPVPDPRLLRLPMELVLARARKGDVIREVTVMDNWITIRRGEQPIGPGEFRLSAMVKDHFATLRGTD
jgi:predicted O-methyltransferase YrrM